MAQQGCQEEALNSKFFGIPRYQPFLGGRSFDYEQKYLPDPLGEEASDEARVWATYLDEAESYDHDMIQGFRDTIDSLLVLAGLFSAVVATFVVQTSQALKPNYAQLSLSIQLEQVALLRTGGNLNAMASIPSSRTTIETPTYTSADLLVNGLFFSSLSLSMATALLAVLVKQWCQAYTKVSSGSARDKALIRSLPLLLHLAFVVFFAGLSFFVYDLHPSLSSIVIIVMVLSLSGYLITAILPALWLEFPYRIPLFFRPSRFMVYIFALFRRYLGYSHLEALPSSLRGDLNSLPVTLSREHVVSSLKEAEQSLLRQLSIFGKLDTRNLATARSFEWLFTLSKNTSTQRIVAQAVYGYITETWVHASTKGEFDSFFSAPVVRSFLECLPVSSLVSTALHSLEPITLKKPATSQLPPVLSRNLLL
ncbi:hypothetical protein DL96DRAFT_1820117 [Flagelloscypha sp. PMI_526]|nr:hypothetical protein DL96DRAFT_1820117 [Flagelloscypha sp. PMI_526]